MSLDFLVFGKEQSNSKNITDDEKELLDYYKELDDYEKGRVIGKAEELAEAARRRKAEAESAKKAKEKSKDSPPELESYGESEENDYIYIDFPDLPVSAGTGVYLNSDYSEQLKVISNRLTIRANYALRIAGDSMQPKYCEGDIVLVETQPSVKVGEIGIFIYEGEAYIKEFGGDRLISVNPKYEDKEITDFNSFYCKGLVIGLLDKKDILN